jgi:hypothetical protein
VLQDFEIVKRIAQSRRTVKVIASPDQPVSHSFDDQKKWKAIVIEAVSVAGMAPFHYTRDVDSVPEPWRVRLLDTDTCRALASNLDGWMELKPSNKIPGLLAGCGCTLLVTWLPQFRDEKMADVSISREKQTEIDDEHLAATAAMVQTQLLLLTAAGLGTYWSSGGVLGAPEVMARLGIAGHERLIAAIFVEYPDNPNSNVERLPGKNRSRRSQLNKWFGEAKLLQNGEKRDV